MSYITTASTISHGAFDAQAVEVSGVFGTRRAACDFARVMGHSVLPLRGEGSAPNLGDTVMIEREFAGDAIGILVAQRGALERGAEKLEPLVVEDFHRRMGFFVEHRA